MTARSAGVALALALLSICTSAQAHREPGVVTRIEWSEQDRALHITHRLHAHDALQLLANDSVALQSVAGRAELALHVESNFALTSGAQSVALEMIGAETDGSDVFVYQMLALPSPPTAIRVSNQMLQSFRGAANTVVFVVGAQTRSVVIRPTADWHALQIQPDGA